MVFNKKCLRKLLESQKPCNLLTIRKDNKLQVWSRCFVLRSCRLFPINREVSLWRPW
uniref:Uncharacterized protein n=1 Tax=Anguilla anguilla TaxID=7936 RepID=A0A0E9Q016_ANGAN